jgi:hypothetical protein
MLMLILILTLKKLFKNSKIQKLKINIIMEEINEIKLELKSINNLLKLILSEIYEIKKTNYNNTNKDTYDEYSLYEITDKLITKNN